jgi:hypothetical protein
MTSSKSASSPLVRYGAYGVGAAAILVLIAGLVVYSINQGRFEPSLPKPPASKAADSAEAQRQDLDYLRNLAKLDRTFTEETAKAFQEKIDLALKDAGTMSPVRFELEVAGAVAQANNVETAVISTERRRRLHRLPVRFVPFAEGAYITKTTVAFGDLLGARLLAIGGVPMEEAMGRFDAYLSGPDWARRYLARDLLQSPEALQAVGLSDQSDSAVLTFLLPSGATETRKLNALPGTLDGLPDYLPWMDLAPGISPGREDENWLELLANPDRVPVTENNIAEPVSFVRMNKPNAILVAINPNELTDAELTARLDAVLVGLREMTPHHLIINLRRTGAIKPGATLAAYNSFIQALPQALPNGAVYILTGPGTGSLGVELIARLQASVVDRVLTLGLPPGQVRRHWAASGLRLTLPNSGISVSIATRLRDVEKGCTSWSDCGFAASRNSLAQGAFNMDVTFIQRLADYSQGKDTAIEVINALMGQPD